MKLRFVCIATNAVAVAVTSQLCNSHTHISKRTYKHTNVCMYACNNVSNYREIKLKYVLMYASLYCVRKNVCVRAQSIESPLRSVLVANYNKLIAIVYVSCSTALARR